MSTQTNVIKLFEKVDSAKNYEQFHAAVVPLLRVLVYNHRRSGEDEDMLEEWRGEFKKDIKTHGSRIGVAPK